MKVLLFLNQSQFQKSLENQGFINEWLQRRLNVQTLWQYLDKLPRRQFKASQNPKRTRFEESFQKLEKLIKKFWERKKKQRKKRMRKLQKDKKNTYKRSYKNERNKRKRKKQKFNRSKRKRKPFEKKSKECLPKNQSSLMERKWRNCLNRLKKNRNPKS